MIDALLQGLSLVLQWNAFSLMLVGMALGFVVGLLPGSGSAGGYTNTPEGKVIASSFADAYNALAALHAEPAAGAEAAAHFLRFSRGKSPPCR